MVSKEVHLKSDSNDSSSMCISYKIIKFTNLATLLPGGPKIVLDHLCIILYIYLCALGFLTIDAIDNTSVKGLRGLRTSSASFLKAES